MQHDFCHGPLEGQERRVARLEVVEPCEVLILARATIRHRFASGLDVKEDDAMLRRTLPFGSRIRIRSPLGWVGVALAVMAFWPVGTALSVSATADSPPAGGHAANALQPETVLQGILQGECEDVSDHSASLPSGTGPSWRGSARFPQPVEWCIRQCYVDHDSRIEDCWRQYDDCIDEIPPGEASGAREELCAIRRGLCFEMSELRLDLCISMCIVRWEPV